MAKASDHQIGKNMIWNAISVGLSAILSFTITPIVTNNIGIEANGIIGLANTLITYLDIITVAINAFAARYIALEYHNKRYNEANKYYSSSFYSNLIVVMLLSVPSTIFIININHILNVSDELVFDSKILFSFVLINWCIGVLGAAYAAAAFVKNRTSITYRNKGISTLIYAVTLGLAIYFFTIHLYFMALGNFFAGLFNFFANRYYAKVLAPELKIKGEYFSFAKVKNLLSSGIWNSINNIGNLLNSGLDLLVCNKMLSGIIMGQVSISKQLALMITTVTTIVVNSFQPKQLELYAKHEKEELIKYLCFSMKLVGLVGNVISVCFIAAGMDFLCLWIPNQDIKTIFITSIIVIIGDAVVTNVRPLFYVFTLTDKLKEICWITIASGTINVISMYFLIKYTNLAGYAVVGTTMVLNLLVQFIAAPLLASKFLECDYHIFIKIVIRHFLTFLSSAVPFYFLGSAVVTTTWFTLILKCIILLALILIVIYMLELNREEKRLLMSRIKGLAVSFKARLK